MSEVYFFTCLGFSGFMLAPPGCLETDVLSNSMEQSVSKNCHGAQMLQFQSRFLSDYSLLNPASQLNLKKTK